jgi:hypothetical protein
MNLKGFAMTRLEIITQFLSQIANQPVSELLSWAHNNIDPAVLQKLNEEVTREEISLLIAELDKSPEAFFNMLLGQVIRQSAQRKSGKHINSGLVEAFVP